MEPDKGALHFSQRMLLELFSQPQFLHLIFFVFSSFSRSFIHGANVSKVFMSSLRSVLRLGHAQAGLAWRSA